MGSIELEPTLDTIPAVLRAGAVVGPLGLSQAIEELTGARACCLKRKQRPVDRAIVVQLPRELGLVVGPNSRPLFRNEQAEPDGRRHFTVGEVMHDFARAPFAR